MSIRNFDLVNKMKMRTKSISALLLATITMASAAVIPATSYNDTVKTNFSHPISNVPGKVARCAGSVIPACWRLGTAPSFELGVHLCVRRFGSDREPSRGSARTHLPRGRVLV